MRELETRKINLTPPDRCPVHDRKGSWIEFRSTNVQAAFCLACLVKKLDDLGIQRVSPWFPDETAGAEHN